MTTNGYIHIYTGDGKGKTTAAIGLAIRAVGAGKTVFIAQFMKGQGSSEINALKTFDPQLQIQQFGRSAFVIHAPTQVDIDLARQGLNAVQKAMFEQQTDVIILDEIMATVNLKLLPLEDLIALIGQKPVPTELILTGRDAPALLVERAHLVSEIVERKHYYQQGVTARLGIEY